MPSDQKLYGLFCWTHRGVNRDRITPDTPIEVACQLSRTISIQYRTAQQVVKLYNGRLGKVFLFEEAFHQPTRNALRVIYQAIDWCRSERATLLIPDLFPDKVGAPVFQRKFGSYEGISQHLHLMKSEIEWHYLPTDTFHEELRQHFVECYALERAARQAKHAQRLEAERQKVMNAIEEAERARKERAVQRRIEGMDQRRKSTGVLPSGFGSDNWEGRYDASAKGNLAKSEKARQKAHAIVNFIYKLLVPPGSYSYERIAHALNMEMISFDTLSPPRAKLWNADSVRVYFHRYEHLVDLRPFDSRQYPRVAGERGAWS
jgi:hypothetical protein